MPASAHAAATVGRRAPRTPSMPTTSWLQVGPRATPRTRPLRETSATSVFEPPPSTARTAARRPLLTGRHLGCERVAARVEAAASGEAPGQKLRRNDGYGRCQAVAHGIEHHGRRARGGG